MYEDDRNSFLFEIHESRVLFSVHVSVVESVCACFLFSFTCGDIELDLSVLVFSL